MALLTKEQILQCKDSETVTVNVPEWGGDVLVATMSGAARDRFEMAVFNKNGSSTNMSNIRAKLVSCCVVDEQGKLLFNESDVVALGKKSCKALDRVFSAAQKLNNLSEDDVEELAKN